MLSASSFGWRGLHVQQTYTRVHQVRVGVELVTGFDGPFSCPVAFVLYWGKYL